MITQHPNPAFFDTRHLHRCWEPCWQRLDETPPDELEPRSLNVQVGSRCVKGSFRKHNEDRCYTDATNGLFFVADGIGGCYGGAKASQILMETLPAQLSHLPESAELEKCAQCAVEEAVDHALIRMAELAEKDPRYCKMGATMALGILREDKLFLARVGDCRVYVIRNGEAVRLTDDQTFVQVLVDAGMLTEEEARIDPRRRLVLNSISAEGLRERLHVEEVSLLPGDVVLLATDGLTTVVSDERIGEIVEDHVLPQQAADELVIEALRNKSKDNVACVVVKTTKKRR